MRMKLAGALIAALLVFGMVFGVGQAAAASLPGEPLYGLKLAAEQARLELTSDPEARAELATELAENRLGEIAQMVAEGQAVDGETAFNAQQQLSWAYQAMRQISGEEQKLQAQEKFARMLANQQGAVTSAVDAEPQQTQEPVRALLRSMVRVRAELHTGEGEASGEQIRTNRDQVPEPAGPVGEPGTGMQAGQDGEDGLLDAAGTGTENGQPNQDASFGPGPELQDGSQGPYEGAAPSYGPGPAEDDAPAGLRWLWQLFKKDSTTDDTDSSSGSSSSGSSGNGRH